MKRTRLTEVRKYQTGWAGDGRFRKGLTSSVDSSSSTHSDAMNERESKKGKGWNSRWDMKCFRCYPRYPGAEWQESFAVPKLSSLFLVPRTGAWQRMAPQFATLKSTFHSVLEDEGSVVCNTWRPCRAVLELRKGIGWESSVVSRGSQTLARGRGPGVQSRAPKRGPAFQRPKSDQAGPKPGDQLLHWPRSCRQTNIDVQTYLGGDISMPLIHTSRVYTPIEIQHQKTPPASHPPTIHLLKWQSRRGPSIELCAAFELHVHVNES